MSFALSEMSTPQKSCSGMAPLRSFTESIRSVKMGWMLTKRELCSSFMHWSMSSAD